MYNRAMSNSYYSKNNSYNGRRSHSYHIQNIRSMSRNFTDNFMDFSSNFQNPISKASRAGFQNARNDLNSTMHNTITSEKSFSSLFDTSKQTSESLSDDQDGGVYLQITNLDQWYDEASLRHYLMSQLKPITPILLLTIETPSIAKVKVPSIQFAKQVVSHLHRKKMGHKRIFVSFIKDKTSAECSALRNKVIGLLKDVPEHELPMSKFRELFQSRFKSSISIVDLYRMPDVCTLGTNKNEEKIITLVSSATQTEEVDMVLKTEQHSAPYCIFHFKPDKNKGWAEIEIEPLPNVFMTIAQVQSMIQLLLQNHQGDIPIASLLDCLEAELNVNIQPDDRGVSLEHLVSCISNVCIRNNDYGIKILSWREDNHYDDVSFSSKRTTKTTLNTSCGESAETISKEVIELIRMCPKATMQFSKFIPTYHNHFGKQCRVADYGCTKLIELFEGMSSIVQVIGEGESRKITLTHRIQIRRFSNDLYKILRNQQSKSIYLSNLPQLYLVTYNRVFDVTDYGVCDIQDLLDGLRNSNFILITKQRDNNDDLILSLQKRRQTNNEIEKTCIFAGEVAELLRNAPQFSIPFRKFVRSYHYYFGYQCKLSDYGFNRLAELLEALSGVVEMDHSNEENRKIFLSRKLALRIFSDQIQEIIKTVTGNSGAMVKVDELMEMHKKKYGYQMQGTSLGYDSVIDALKFVPFLELNSFENELWLVSHLENDKFRQRAMMACVAISDIGIKVPLTKFQAVFNEKFKFSLHEKSLHAMKHAVEIEMVNGNKMIAITPMMKFIMHIVNVLEQRKVMNVQEIKSMMKLNLSTCFNFGHPNLSSLLQAFPDIFKTTNNGVNLHERSDVELNSDCPLSSSGLQKLLSLNRVQIPDEKPEIYRQNIRVHPIGYNPNRSQRPLIAKLNNHSQQYIQLNPFCRNFNNHLNTSTGSSDVSLPIDSFANMSLSSSTVSNQYDEEQGFYEQNLKFQQQQRQIQSFRKNFYNNSGAYSPTPSSNLEGTMYQQQCNMMPFHRYEPPKPDTPPSKPMGIWFDPVWKSQSDFEDTDYRTNSNNTSDSIKSFNVHVVSPFMSFKTMFTFDNVHNNSK
ncbi:putative Meiosis regulator and mRNA stability factor 1 [Polypedilum vanderplanki]|uniref:Meiosis regulator and mRNA stability factor 1 n=1 Tax=Polypedilum vanderplanki TaxID=319348 RepID=A0A9J6C8F5_POLVA|nr:putative Meiosis regulator and mRNA stability factor 1 [Polypedilum vanderplanki]